MQLSWLWEAAVFPPATHAALASDALAARIVALTSWLSDAKYLRPAGAMRNCRKVRALAMAVAPVHCPPEAAVIFALSRVSPRVLELDAGCRSMGWRRVEGGPGSSGSTPEVFISSFAYVSCRVCKPTQAKRKTKQSKRLKAESKRIPKNSTST